MDGSARRRCHGHDAATRPVFPTARRPAHGSLDASARRRLGALMDEGTTVLEASAVRGCWDAALVLRLYR